MSVTEQETEQAIVLEVGGAEKKRTLYGWNDRYGCPSYWDNRTVLHLGMPRYFRFYQNINDIKLRRFFSGLRGLVLDAGCGEGRFMAYADVGVDFSAGMLKRAKARCRGRQFVRASVACLPFRTGVFSNVFSVDVMLHVPAGRQGEAQREMRRVAENVYVYLPEHRTVSPFLLSLFSKAGGWLPRRLVPLLVVLLAFPVDRAQGLKRDQRGYKWFFGMRKKEFEQRKELCSCGGRLMQVVDITVKPYLPGYGEAKGKFVCAQCSKIE